MKQAHSHLWPGVPLALVSAVLFGASPPFAKPLICTVPPQLFAGLLYLGAGVGLAVVHGGRAVLGIPAQEAPLRRHNLSWVAAVVLFGGLAGPLLLMLVLSHTSAASGSLLLNLEGLATIIIACMVFRENVDRRLLLCAFAILVGAAVLSWSSEAIRLVHRSRRRRQPCLEKLMQKQWPSARSHERSECVRALDAGAAFIPAASLAWGIDNNLIRKLSSADPVVTVAIKGW